MLLRWLFHLLPVHEGLFIQAPLDNLIFSAQLVALLELAHVRLELLLTI